MPSIYIRKANLVLKDRILKDSSLFIEGKRIAAVGKAAPPAAKPLTIDAKGLFVSPGFIDTHIHGSPKKIFQNEISGGTTSFMTAIPCSSPTDIKMAAREAKKFKTSRFGESLLGLRLEGPFINKYMAGAQNSKLIKEPNTNALKGILNIFGSLLKIVTVAPELEGAGEVIKALKKRGIVASIGHSDTSEGEARFGIERGIRHATHLFNRLSPAAIKAMLKDKRVWTEVIPESRHTEPEEFRTLLRYKDIGKIILVTDSVRALYPASARKGSIYRLKDGTIAGSALTMVGAVKNAVKYYSLPLVTAVRMATLNPARLLNIKYKKGLIAAGMDADLLIFDKDFNVKMALVRGKIVYQRGM